MRKYIVLFGGLFIISVAFIAMYMSYAPRIGPIGNGPNDKLIWFNFTVQLISGLSITVTAILMFLQESAKKGKEKF